MSDLKLGTVAQGDTLVSILYSERKQHTVSRVTATTVATADGLKWKKADGSQIGAGNDARRAAPLSAADTMHFRVKEATELLKHVRVTPENVDAVERLIKLSTEQADKRKRA